MKSYVNKVYRNYLKILFCVLALFLGACDSPKLTALNSNEVIVAFGDSLTSGVGVTSGNSYPSILEELSGLKVVNSGVSGETTEGGLSRFADVITKYTPGLIILLEGGNDILQNKRPDEIERNLGEMINIAHASGVQVVLIGVPEKSLFSNSAPLYRRLAEQHELVFEPELIGKLMRSPSKKSDPVHFNEAGYASMAERIYELLSKNGAFE